MGFPYDWRPCCRSKKSAWRVGGSTDAEDARKLLDDVSLRMRRGQLIGVVGPSGCGKSTLLKLIAGLLEPTAGAVRWDGRNLAHEGDLPPHELGYVPQFSIAHDLLTVRECVDYAARLRVAGFDPDARAARVDTLLETTGLAPLADRPARVLSGGQRRRLVAGHRDGVRRRRCCCATRSPAGSTPAARTRS